MDKIKRTLGTIAFAGLIGLSCSNKINEGEIYEKIYEPEKKEIVLIPIINVVGYAIIMTPVPMLVYDDTDFIIKIRKYNEEKNDYDSGACYLDSLTFNKVKVGDWFFFDKQNTKIEDKLIKRKATVAEVRSLNHN